MSALARYFKDQGKTVCGYDKTETSLTKELLREGMEITFSDQVETIPALVKNQKEKVTVVYTPAIPKDSIQYNWFLNNGFEVLKRSVVLGNITANTYNISVAGTHGKTTTSCMVAHLFKTANIPFAAFLGGISTDLGSNYFNSGLLPDGRQITVTEADEFDRSFLTLTPDLAVITSMDADHLDIYGKDESVKESFRAFAKKLKPDGTLFHSFGLQELLPQEIYRKSYGLKAGTIHAEQIRFEKGYFLFDLWFEDDVYHNVKLSIPGWHNVVNALAAASIARKMGASEDAIRKGLSTFKGVKRRFEYIVNTLNVVYIDDYAHHPSELKAIISSVRKMYPEKKITGIFQPHLYSRTRDFCQGFAESLDLLDEALVMPIYPARELPIPGVNSEMILQQMKLGNKAICQRKHIISELDKRGIEVLLTLGAGDIDLEPEKIKNWINEKYQ